MNKYKICVYTIAKNEEQFVDRWVNSAKEADLMLVLDTGSTDDTVKKLKEKGVVVHEKIISPWRFDTARNEALKYIPDDIDFCISVDMDEYFDTGWREILEKNLNLDTLQVRYRYTWNFNEDGSEGTVFYAEKVHRNKAFVWQYPVHEILKQIDFSFNKIITLPALHLNHKADNTKSRGQYLSLLEQSVKENPENDRNMHYLGREYSFYKMYDKSIKTLKKHLTLKSSVWKDERCASLRLIATDYLNLGKFKLAEKYYKLAIIEANYLREPYLDLAIFYFNKKRYLDCALFLESMLKITNYEPNYITNQNCWNETPYDLLSICYYYLNKPIDAIKNAGIALTYSPNNERIKNNLNLYKNKINNK